MSVVDLNIKEKLAPITGSAAGIGFSIGKARSTEGARTLVSARAEASAESALFQIKASR
jgi:3-oxoacyl-[acyl-carrier protein] reductase